VASTTAIATIGDIKRSMLATLAKTGSSPLELECWNLSNHEF
jgi:hypothetical protein